MSLLVTKVPRSLEAKTKLFGFELGDLLLVFFYLSISNLIFGSTVARPIAVWLGTGVLAGVLYFSKRGKPDGYLQHLGEYSRLPGVLSPGVPDTEYYPYLQSRQNGGIQIPTDGRLHGEK